MDNILLRFYNQIAVMKINTYIYPFDLLQNIWKAANNTSYNSCNTSNLLKVWFYKKIAYLAMVYPFEINNRAAKFSWFVAVSKNTQKCDAPNLTYIVSKPAYDSYHHKETSSIIKLGTSWYCTVKSKCVKVEVNQIKAVSDDIHKNYKCIWIT